MSDGKVVREALASLQCPQFGDSVWVAPFELLTGAAYALLGAERHGYWHRDQRKYEYHAHVRENIAILIAEHPFGADEPPQSAFEDWVAGFYFNAAEERLVCAAERMLTTFAGVECECGRAGELRDGARHSYGEVWDAAWRRLEHIGTEHQKDLSYVAVLLRQMPSEKHHRREMVFDPESVLALLRYHLEQKHALSAPGHESNQAVRTRACWATAPPGVQMEFVCAAFSLLCHAFNEIVQWHGAARERTPTALGELA